MKVRVVLIVLVVAIVSGCALIGALFPGTWEIVGNEGFSAPDTDYVRVGLDEVDGVIYTAFQEGSLGSVSVMKYEEFGSQTWQYVGGSQITGQKATHISLFVDDGTPYISFSDDTPGVDEGLSVMMFDGANWSYLVSAGGISTYSITYSDLFVEAGVVYVAYRENFTVGGVSNVRISMYDGASWQLYSGDPVVEAGSGGSDFIDIDRYSGTTYVSFTDNDTGVASVISSTGSSWASVGTAAISNGDGEYVSLAIDDGTPYVAFSEGTGELSVMSFDGAAWSYVDRAAISEGVTSDVSMDFLDGTAIVAYSDWSNNYKLSVQSMGRRTWEYVDQPGFTAGRATSVSLKAGNAAYYVAFADDANGGSVTVVRYR